MRKSIVSAVAAAGVAIASSGMASTADASSGCGYRAGYYVTANGNTSCSFARNVAAAYANGYRRPWVYSPTTGRSYRMSCRGGYWTGHCSGGNGAFVWLSR